MNYRHLYHAGNFADIVKHCVLALALDYLVKKEKGLFLLDAFAGCGIYDLTRPEAQKTQEYESGIGRLMAVSSVNPDLRFFQGLFEKDWKRQTYPGSPLLLARQLRSQDRLIANELHPEDFEQLRTTLAPFEKARVMRMDAYECLRAHLPPPERRGLILIDPPFEKPDEFQQLARQMREWKKRFPTGVYLLWYPIKAGLPVAALHDEAHELGMNRTWAVDFLLDGHEGNDKLAGCGLLLFNTPFGLPERLAACSKDLGTVLGGKFTPLWLREDPA